MTSYLVAIPTRALRAMEKNGTISSESPVWKIDRFATKSGALDGLEQGGALFLCTVSLLGFVTLRAVLESPVLHEGVWIAPNENVVPPRVLSGSMSKLGFVRALALAPIDRRYKTVLLAPQPLTARDELVVRGGVAAATKLGRLRIVSKKRPKSVAELDTAERKQLRAAGRGHDGKDLPAEARLAKRPPKREPDPQETFVGVLQILALANDEGRVLYDVYVCGPDTGAVFRAKTVKQVAELIQGGIQCDDAALSEQLRRALAGTR